jgi:hypothetical protein
VEFALLPDDTVRLRVLTRGSAGLFGLLAIPGEAKHALDEIDGAVTSAGLHLLRANCPRGVNDRHIPATRDSA